MKRERLIWAAANVAYQINIPNIIKVCIYINQKFKTDEEICTQFLLENFYRCKHGQKIAN